MLIESVSRLQFFQPSNKNPFTEPLERVGNYFVTQLYSCINNNTLIDEITTKQQQEQAELKD